MTIIITINITTDIYTDTNTNIKMDSNNIETQRWALKGGEAAEGREWRWSWELFWKSALRLQDKFYYYNLYVENSILAQN